jgi:hypothetical protein
MNTPALDKLLQDVANASSPFALGNDWQDIKAGMVEAAAWKADIESRLAALESPHIVVIGEHHPGPTGSGD